MALRKTTWIRRVNLALIDNSTVVPTVLYYDEQKQPFVGAEARERCSPEFLVEDFKLELGAVDPGTVAGRSPSTTSSARRTGVGLAKDFFDETLKKVNNWLQIQGLSLPTKILIAEPLSLGSGNLADETWLSNYRKSVRRALASKFKEIDFMPEPFAVFQYYRYGAQHPLVAEQRKHVALVLDFGGGTFDVSVVETTRLGDISMGGSTGNSRPLSARSIAVAGFYFNRIIAEDLLFSVLDKRIDRRDVRKSLENFYKNKNADEDFLSALSEKQAAFFKNHKRLLHDVERAKLAVCRSIANWSLSADLTGSAPYPLSVPTNPFSSASERANTRLDAAKLRKLFEGSIWAPKLKEAINTSLTRARDELRGQEISLILLSGGSSNIGWLKELLERDVLNRIPGAQILELNEDFQEIVAKGLATECARRHFTAGQGDFRAVTYNRLCLVLRPDNGDLEIQRFYPITEELGRRTLRDAESDEGVLLPAASSLRGLIGQPLRWRVRLTTPPRRHLEYHFLRSSFDPEDTASLQNVEEMRLNTPKNTSFQSSIEVELIVREDGTAEPKFTYNSNKGLEVKGRPFYLDMTFAAEEVEGESYLGFDFGTSTSACSFVDSRHIQIVERQSESTGWRELSDLVGELPYPCAAPLGRFMSEMDRERRMHRGREAAEALLTLIAYTSFADLCARSGRHASYFKGFAHRSAGPLWALSKQCLRHSDKSALFSVAFMPLVSGSVADQLDQWVSQIPDLKHGRPADIDYVSFLALLGNHVARTFSESVFGVFENVTPKKFSPGRFRGLFRNLRGSSQPFIHVLEYEGTTPFSDADVFWRFQVRVPL